MLSTALALDLPQPAEQSYQATIDLAVLAQVNRGDRIEVQRISDRTLELFQRTIRVLDDQHEQASRAGAAVVDSTRFVPEHSDLRERFLFAEALGSYSALHDLLDAYSPAYRLSMDCGERARIDPLSAGEIKALEEYRDQIHQALIHANAYLFEHAASGFSADELHELNELLIAAKQRCESVTAILGIQLIRDVEDAVRKLYEFQEKIRSVRRTIDGIFLVDSEVMFIPTNDLIKIVGDLFKAVGNPFVAENIDGMLLLAARNLLIQAVSFYSYYGKQQIYNIFRKDQATISRSLLAHHIRAEIRNLFRACTAQNKLVLKRVMNNAEREFEISADTIQAEAERAAIRAVNLLIPQDIPAAPATPKQGFMRRLAGWLFR